MTDDRKPGDDAADSEGRDRPDASSVPTPPEFGSPFDYDATADASLTESTSGTSAVPPSGGNSAGPGWDTYSGVGNGPGWGTGPSYPPPSGDPLPPPTSGPVYGTPSPEYGQSTPPPPTTPSYYSNYPSSPGYPSAGGYPPAYGGYGDPGAPFGRDPLSGAAFSDKSKVTAGLLQLLLGFVGLCGIGRLYLGYTAIGLVQLIGWIVAFFLSFALIGIPFAIAIWIWALVEGIMMLTGSIRDTQGRPLRS